MSETHILVEKNGIEDRMNKTVWEAIGGPNNKDGWKLVPQAPIEVVQMKQKATISKEEPSPETGEPVIDPVGSSDTEANAPVVEKISEIKSKSKPAKKK